jgi:hypothetical protein
MSGYRTIFRLEVGLFRFRLWLDFASQKGHFIYTVVVCFVLYIVCFRLIRRIVKTTISFVISARLSFRMKQLGSQWTVFMKFDI